MAILKTFAIYDSKVEAYLRPFFMRTPGEAIRSFATAANTKGNEFHEYAADFTLFHLGSYNEDNAAFDMFEAKIPLCTALECIENTADASQLSLAVDN